MIQLQSWISVSVLLDTSHFLGPNDFVGLQCIQCFKQKGTCLSKIYTVLRLKTRRICFSHKSSIVAQKYHLGCKACMTSVDVVNANLRLKRAADIMTVLMPEIAGA